MFGLQSHFLGAEKNPLLAEKVLHVRKLHPGIAFGKHLELCEFHSGFRESRVRLVAATRRVVLKVFRQHR